MPVNLQLVAGTLPTGYCFTTPQVYYNDIFRLGHAVFPGDLNVYNFGDSTPDVEDQGYPWLKTIGGAPNNWFKHHNGLWLWPYPIPAGPNAVRWLWEGTEADLDAGTWDGGDGDPVSATSGPFWEVDHNYDYRSPIGPGTLPTSGSVIAAGTNFGEERHTQTIAEMPAHTHETNVHLQIAGAASGSGGDNAPSYDTPSNNTTSTGGGTAFNVVHPVRGAFVIKRTVRIYLKG